MIVDKLEYIGKVSYTNKGDKITIIEYESSRNITVLFENGFTKKISHQQFLNGGVNNPSILAENRIGKVMTTKFGDTITILEYTDSQNVIIKFENGGILKVKYSQIKKGNIENPYAKTIFNIGYIGSGIYNSSKSNKKSEKRYRTWIAMFERCYNKDYHKKKPTYIGCTVYEEWHNFQTFAKWYDDNYYEIEGNEMGLDKDILIKGNKVYSAETCVFVPKNINTLFVKADKLRGICPIGVHYSKKQRGYITQCVVEGKRKYIACYDTPIDAFNSYKFYKEKHIKEVAEEYKNDIPTNLYDAMYNYKVEITD